MKVSLDEQSTACCLLMYKWKVMIIILWSIYDIYPWLSLYRTHIINCIMHYDLDGKYSIHIPLLCDYNFRFTVIAMFNFLACVSCL